SVSFRLAIFDFRMPLFGSLDRHLRYIHSANASERAAEIIMNGTDPTADVQQADVRGSIKFSGQLLDDPGLGLDEKVILQPHEIDRSLDYIPVIASELTEGLHRS